jgi:hypothetical protein
MNDIPSNEPASLRIGDTWKWTRHFDDYPAASWTLKYRFKHATLATGFEIVASTSGSDYAVTVTAATTGGYTAGKYTWIAWVEGGSSEKYTVDTGSTTLTPDYRAGTVTTALDDRSHPRKMLDAIEAWLESRDVAVAEYEIAGRRMKYIPIADLIKLRSRYQNELAAADNAEKLAKGEGFGRKIQFRI